MFRKTRNIFFLLLLLFAAIPVHADEEKTVLSITVTGNERITDKYILRNIKTREGKPFSPKVWNEDLRRLYDTGLFNDVVTAVTGETEDGVNLRITVDERVIVDRVVYKGNRKIDDDDLREMLFVRSGMALDKGRINLDVNTIREAYREKSYLFTEVTPEVAEAAPGRVVLIYNIEENTKTLVGGISFTGNDNMDADQLRKVMETKIDRWYNSAKFLREKLEADLGRIKSYYLDHGYLDVEVRAEEPSFNESRDRIFISIQISERERYTISEVRITGVEAYAEETVRALTKLRAGDFFSLREMYRDAGRIEKHYKSDGRIFTRVQPLAVPDRERTAVRIEHKVGEGREVMIREIRIRGNEKTRDIVIRREMEFFPGEKFNYEKIRESMDNLKRLAYFEKIDIKEIPTDVPELADVEVTVGEQPTGQINLGFGFSTIESFMGTFSIRQRNFDIKDKPDSGGDFFSGKSFVGDGQDMAVVIRAGTRTQSYKLSFLEPWLFNRKIWFGFDLYTTFAEYDEYDEERTGGDIRIGRELVKDLRLTGKYSWQLIELDDVSDFSSSLILEEEGTSIISSISLDLNYDKRDSRYIPSKGWYFGVNEKVAGGPLGGTENFYRTSVKLQGFLPVANVENWGRHIIGTKMSGTHVQEFGDSDKVPVFERLFGGGINSVRGFEFRELGPEENGTKLGGNFRLLGTAEYSMPIYKDQFRIGFFSDAGYVWRRISDYDGDDFRVSVGVSLKVKLPISPIPISFNWAQPVRRETDDDIQIFSFNFGSIF